MNEAAVDRVGIGWRPELAAGIWAHLDQIDLVEVIADDLFRASADRLNALKTLGAQVPLSLHGVSMGMASTVAVSTERLDAMARLCERLEPQSWSEHLAFVRGGGYEIGHLAMPPRCAETIEGAAANAARATAIVGQAPLLENVASLIDAPGSTLSEPAFLGGVLRASACELLLDLHNLYTNAFNFGFDAHQALRALPLDRIGAVHLAGGRMLQRGSRPRVLDDHLHDVPVEVFALLEELAASCPHPLTVVLERDGRYPSMAHLVSELNAARSALARGRARAVHPPTVTPATTLEAR